MAAAKDTFIDNILQKAGFTNVINHLSRYPEINPTQLHSANPDFIFLSSEPYPFTQKHIAELQVICPFSKILLVDGELFSWYGSRLVKSAAYFLELRQRVSKFFISWFCTKFPNLVLIIANSICNVNKDGKLNL